MEELKKLAQIIKRRGVAEEPLLNFKNKRPSKEFALFNALALGIVNNEEEAFALLYQDSPSKAGFKMVKSRLRKKLMNQLFFLESQSAKSAQHIEQQCLSKVFQGRLLVSSGAYEMAHQVLKQALAISEEYHFNEISYLCLRSLLYIYVNLGEKNLFNKAAKQLDALTLALQADQQSEKLYLESSMELKDSIVSRKKYLLKIEDVLKEMEALWRRAQTFDTFDNFYRLTIWSQELKGDFNRIVELTNESEELLKNNKLLAHRFDQRYNKFIQVYAHLRAKKLEAGLVLAEAYEPYFNPSSNNWFAFMENYMLLALHSRKYDVAHTLLNRILRNPFYKKITKLAQERWNLFEAYLQIVEPLKEKSFKWHELVHSSPSYSKDKEGFNVAILILQVMYFLENQDMETLEYRMEALKKYAHKHFKDSFSERSRTFFKLLGVLVRTEFDPHETSKKGHYLFQKLQKIPPPGDAYAEIEIIPYEHLWELIIKRLQLLQKNKLRL